MSAGFPKIKISGIGEFKQPPAKQLNRMCQVGDIVSWEMNGKKSIGELKSWDIDIALIDTGADIKAVVVNTV